MCIRDRSTPAPAPAPAPSDSTAPVVTITQPAADSIVQGTITIGANVTDSSPISSVTFSVDGVGRASDSAAPYSWSWDSRTLANGTHTFGVSARDAAGNVGRTSLVVQVNNPVAGITTDRTSKGRARKVQETKSRATRIYSIDRKSSRRRLR